MFSSKTPAEIKSWKKMKSKTSHFSDARTYCKTREIEIMC